MSVESHMKKNHGDDYGDFAVPESESQAPGDEFGTDSRVYLTGLRNSGTRPIPIAGTSPLSSTVR